MLTKLKTWGRAIRRDVTALYLAARDPGTRWYVKALALLIAGYALSPIDLIPDVIPVLGLLDEAILLPLAIWGLIKLIPPADMARFRAAASILEEQPRSRFAAAIIISIWTAALGLAIYLAVKTVYSS
jgi:uncharacterized membrane protein YkvA (DUF1232 family)